MEDTRSIQQIRLDARRDAALKRKARELAAVRERQMKTIYERVSMGQSLKEACDEDKALPNYITALAWLRDDPDFAETYRQAQRNRADTLFDETLAIADDSRNDWMQRNDPNNPGWMVNGEVIARSKMRIDTRFKIASKVNPGRYGDKLAIEGDPTKPLVVSVTHRIVQVVQPEGSGPVIEATPAEPDKWADPEE